MSRAVMVRVSVLASDQKLRNPWTVASFMSIPLALTMPLPQRARNLLPYGTMTTRRATPTVHPDLPAALRAALDAAQERGITQRAVYEAMGYAPAANGASPALSRALHGHRNWKLSQIVAFAHATGETLRYMCDGAEIEVHPGVAGEVAA